MRGYPVDSDREMNSQDDKLLGSLRRIIRAVDLHSKRLERETGLTTPQVLVLMAIRELGEVTTARIAARVSLSQATVTTIVDRLVARGLIERYRNTTDRRIVHSRLTATGEAALAKAPPLLDTIFVTAFRSLPASERDGLVAALERVAMLMGPAASAEPAPLIDLGEIAPALPAQQDVA